MRHNKGIAYMWGVHMTMMVVAITMLKHKGYRHSLFCKKHGNCQTDTCVHTRNVTSHGLTYIVFVARAVTFTWLDFYIAPFPNSCTFIVFARVQEDYERSKFFILYMHGHIHVNRRCIRRDKTMFSRNAAV